MITFKEFVEGPLYRPVKLELDNNYKLIPEHLDIFYELVNFENVNTRFYCPSCNELSSFFPNSNYKKSYSLGLGDEFILHNQVLVDYDGVVIKEQFINDEKIFRTILSCTHNESHKIILYTSLRVSGSTLILTKIGQTPHVKFLNLNDIKPFKKDLDKFDSYDDFNSAITLNSEGWFVASLTYLRRVFEKMINFHIEDDEIKKSRYSDRIDYLKEKGGILSPDISDMSITVYKLLSGGVHAFTESECEEMYEALFSFVSLQLAYLKSKRDEKDNVKLLKSKLSRFSMK